jgi:hypothetical protein
MASQQSRHKYAITTIRARDQVEEMREVWEKLQAHPNSDIDLYLAILDASPEQVEPYVLFLSREGKPEGMAVGLLGTFELPLGIGYKTFFTPKLRALTLLPGAVQGDLSKEFSSPLLDTIRELLSTHEVDLVRLIDVPAASNLASLAIRRSSWLCRDHVRWSGRHWKIILPDSSDAFFHRIKRKHRRILQKVCELMSTQNRNVRFSAK